MNLDDKPPVGLALQKGQRQVDDPHVDAAPGGEIGDAFCARMVELEERRAPALFAPRGPA